MDIFCVGLMVCDILVKPVDAGIFKEDSRIIERMDIAVGGDAVNASIHMSRMDLNVALCGCVGNDALGRFLVEELQKNGVNTEGVRFLQDAMTSTSIALIEKQGERHFIYDGRANNCLTVGDINWDIAKKAKILHVGSAMALDGLDYEGIAALFCKAKEYGIKTSMDVTWDRSGKWIEKISKALPYTDYFLPSFQEAALLSGGNTYEEISKFFEKAGVNLLAIKNGDQGCYLTDFQQSCTLSACENIHVADTTGAGDAFVAGFLTGQIKGWSLDECGRFANTLGAMCVGKVGATTATEDFVSTRKFMEQMYPHRSTESA